MSLVATMSKEADGLEFCTYANCKIDAQVLRLVKAAAGLSGQKIQDWLSDVANRQASQELNRKPIKRRPSPPKKGAGDGDE